MSFRYTRAVRAVKNITATEQHILMYLCDRCDDRGQCYPSQDTIGKDTFRGERVVRAALQSLEKNKLIARSRRTNRFGDRTSDLITVLIQPAESAGLSVTDAAQSSDSQPAVNDSQPAEIDRA
ncbi:MAG: helix-turn-helix domain-containing protein [Xanthobacteraceae bacterium]|nr:helix-turn-helix domain-containing protein [Xanthobacteraceae bacterium]